MQGETIDLNELLEYIDPSNLNYQEWLNVGLALKHEGYGPEDWDAWSRKDIDRYRSGECSKKWNTFNGNGKPITAGTLISMAKDNGWTPPKPDGWALDWDDVIGQKKDDLVIIDKHYLQGRDIDEPTRWQPVKELITYLETLFESTENVGYVTKSFERDGRHMPTKGSWSRTAGELIEQLNKCNGDIGAVLGDYNPEIGAWIRFNPLDGKDVRNENVTDFRYALVESDSVDVDKQNAIIRELELPVACLVHSGNKSIHAIVRVDAGTYEEYRKRVNYLYDVCQKNGLKIDTQNRNPSRLSRMPGVMRKGQKQFLIDTNIGKESWNAWHEWIEGVNDNLPDPENLNEVWNNLPPLSPPLIEGVLRQGHKMLLAGPSKAGKSYMLIEFCIAIAEGKSWLGWDCAKGRVLYVNLELDRASCLHRFKDVYQALGWEPANVSNIDIWNLRGNAVAMDKLAPKLIRRAQKKGYIAVVIDPIYKVITGDENSADQMAHFTNQFDKVCTELGSAVIYCHHHSKGYQGNKRSMDRASGSGVFARDPDCLLDLVELELPEAMLENEQNKHVAAEIVAWLTVRKPDYDRYSQDDEQNAKDMLWHASQALPSSDYKKLQLRLETVRKEVAMRSAWRIEGTLREFPKFAPLNVWFDYPIHRIDTSDNLKDLAPEGDKPPWQKAMDSRKSPEEKSDERKNSLEIAFSALEFEDDSPISVDDLAEEMGVTKRTVWNRIKEHGGFKTEKRDDKKAYVTRK